MRRWEGGRTAPNCTFYQGGLNPNIFGASHLIICVLPIQTILNTFWWGHRVWYTTVHAIQNLGQNGCQNRRQVWRKPNQPSAGILINFSRIRKMCCYFQNVSLLVAAKTLVLLPDRRSIILLNVNASGKCVQDKSLERCPVFLVVDAFAVSTTNLHIVPFARSV